MRLERRNLILAALLALLLGADALLREPSRADGPATPLLADFDPASAAVVRIERAGEVLELVREDGADGSRERWTVRQRGGYHAHGGAIEELLARLRGLSSSGLVASDPSSHELYGVGEDAARIRVLDAGGRGLVELVVGAGPEGGTGSHVRLEGEDEVYRAPSLAVVDPDPVRWLDARVLDFDPTTVRSFTVRLGEDEAQLIVVEDGRWRAVGGTRLIPRSAVDPLLLTAANLYLADVSTEEPHALGLDAPRLALELQPEDGGVLRLALAADETAGGRPASGPGGTAALAVLLPESSARRLEAAARSVLDALRQ